MHDPKLLEAMARAIFDQREDDGATWACDGTREIHREEATAALTALTTLHPGIAEYLRGDAVVVPRELDEVAAWSMREAFRSSRRGGISGMSLDAQFKVGFAPEIAAYRAMLAASPYAKETPDAR